MIHAIRDVGGHGGLGSRRHERYRAAFDRVMDCVEKEYYLEAIAILDSLICDRLSSRLAYVMGSDVDLYWTCPWLCGKLLGKDPPKNARCEKDQDFRNAVRDIQKWADRRNEALHSTAKVLRSDTSRLNFAAILRSHRKDAVDGIKYLQVFDALDTKSRASVGKKPASYPNAFLPKRSRTRSRR